MENKDRIDNIRRLILQVQRDINFLDKAYEAGLVHEDIYETEKLRKQCRLVDLLTKATSLS